jgi:hypothetical protein
MEAELKGLVLEHGFEAVYVALKGIVISEYERAKRDFEFLAALEPAKKEVAEASTDAVEVSEAVEEESKEESVEPDTKKIAIVVEPASIKTGRKFFKKGSEKK